MKSTSRKSSAPRRPRANRATFSRCKRMDSVGEMREPSLFGGRRALFVDVNESEPQATAMHFRQRCGGARARSMPGPLTMLATRNSA